MGFHCGFLLLHDKCSSHMRQRVSGVTSATEFLIVLLRSLTSVGKDWKNTMCFINLHSMKCGGIKSGDLGGHAVAPSHLMQ